MTPILADWEELMDYRDMQEAGEDTSNFHFSNEVRDMPEQFKEWIEENRDRIENAKSMPYFIKNNYVDGDVNKGLKWEAPVTEPMRHKFGSSSLYETKESKRFTEDAFERKVNQTPVNFTNEQVSNNRELEQALGIKRGNTMTYQEADMGKSNAYYKTDVLYEENCTLSSFAYEMRRRGFPVTASAAREGSIAWEVGDDYKIAWKNPTVNTLYGDKKNITEKLLDSQTKSAGRYHLFMDFKVGESHTIIAERLKDGTLVFIDEQDNSKWAKSFLANVSKMEIFRVDNLCVNPEVAKHLIQPYYGEKIKAKR